MNISQLRVASLVAVLIAVAVLVIDEPGYSWVELQFVLFVLLLSTATRTISLRYAITMFATGVSIATGLTLLVGNLLDASGYNMSGVGIRAVTLPVVEELAKLLPALVAVVIIRRRTRVLPNPSDLLVLTAMCGAGFSIVEKSYWEGVVFNFTYGPQLAGMYLFPDALGISVDGSRLGFIGHAPATALVGLGLGLGLQLQRRAFARTWWWALPIVALAWVTLEHALLNLYYANGSTVLRWLGGGMLTPWLFTLALVAVLAIDAGNAFVTWRASAKLRVQFGASAACLREFLRARRPPPLAWGRLAVTQLRWLNRVAWFNSRYVSPVRTAGGQDRQPLTQTAGDQP